MEIKQTPESSQISSIGYDVDKKIFEIVYKNGSKYHYFDCKLELWDQAKAADSVGKFCAAHIKPHKYIKIG